MADNEKEVGGIKFTLEADLAPYVSGVEKAIDVLESAAKELQKSGEQMEQTVTQATEAASAAVEDASQQIRQESEKIGEALGEAAKDADEALKGIGEGFAGAGDDSEKAGEEIPEDAEKIRKALEKMAQEAASDLDKFQQKLDAIRLQEKLSEFAGTSLIDSTQISMAASVLNRFSASNDEVITSLTALGEIATATDGDLAELAITYSRIKVAGTASMESLNSLMSQGVPIVKELTRSLNLTEEQVLELARDGKISFADIDRALQNLTTGTGEFADATKKAALKIPVDAEVIEDAFEEIEEAVVEVEEQVEEMVDTAEKELSHFQRLANNINLSAIGNGIRSAGAGIMSFGTMLTAGVTTPIIGAGVASVKFAADLQQTQMALEVILKSSERAGSLMAEWREFAAKTPFQFEEIASSGKMLIAFGESAENVTETMRRIGDVAAGAGIPLQELAELYGKARTAGTAYSEDLNQMAGRGIPIFEELAKVISAYGTEVKASDIKKLASEGVITFKEIEQVFKNLTTEGGAYAGLMDKLSESASGKFSTAIDNLKAIAVRIGEIILPVFVDFLDYVIELADSFTRYLTPDMGKFLIVLAGVAAAAGPLLIALGGIVMTVGSAVAGIGGLITIGPAIAGVFTAIVGILTAMGPVLLAVIAGAVALGAAIIALIGSSIDWAKAFEGIKEKSKEAFTYILGFLYNIKENWKTLTDSMTKDWSSMSGDMLVEMSTMHITVLKSFMSIFMSLANLKQRFINVFSGWLSGKMLDVFELIWKGDFLRIATEALNTLISKAVKMGKDFFWSFLTGQKTAQQAINDYQKGIGGDLAGGLRDAFAEEMKGIGEDVIGALPSVDLPAFNTELPSFGTDAEDAGKETGKTFAAGIQGAIDSVLGGDGASEGLRAAVEKLKGVEKAIEGETIKGPKIDFQAMTDGEIRELFGGEGGLTWSDLAADAPAAEGMADDIFESAFGFRIDPITGEHILPSDESEQAYRKPEVTVSEYSSSALGVETEYRDKQVTLLERIAAAVESAVPSPLVAGI